MVLTPSLKVPKTGRSIQAANVFLEVALRRGGPVASGPVV